jgi:hypothetical protein
MGNYLLCEAVHCFYHQRYPSLMDTTRPPLVEIRRPDKRHVVQDQEPWEG